MISNIVEFLNNQLLEAYNNGNSNTIKKTLKIINEDKNVRDLYFLVNAILDGSYKEKTAKVFLKESITLAKNIDVKSLKNFSKKLPKSKGLYKDIDILLFEEKNVLNFKEKLLSENTLVKKLTLIENSTKTIDTDKYDKLLDSLSKKSKDDYVFAVEFLKNPSQIKTNLLEDTAKVIDDLIIENKDNDEMILNLTRAKINMLESDLTNVESLLEIRRLKKDLLNE